MRKVKVLFLGLIVITVGIISAVFMDQNDGTSAAIDLLFAGPFTLPLGQLMLFCFAAGAVCGGVICSLYIFAQSLELRRVNKALNGGNKSPLDAAPTQDLA